MKNVLFVQSTDCRDADSIAAPLFPVNNIGDCCQLSRQCNYLPQRLAVDACSPGDSTPDPSWSKWVQSCSKAQLFPSDYKQWTSNASSVSTAHPSFTVALNRIQICLEKTSCRQSEIKFLKAAYVINPLTSISFLLKLLCVQHLNVSLKSISIKTFMHSGPYSGQLLTSCSSVYACDFATVAYRWTFVNN